MKKILIIGATGSIGSEVTAHLLDKTNAHLTLLARHVNQPNQERVTWVQGDATNIVQLEKIMVNQDSVFVAVSGQLAQVAKAVVTTITKLQIHKLIFIAAMGIYNEIPASVGASGNLTSNGMLQVYRQAADIVTDSTLNYTVIRPGWFDQGNHDYEVTGRNAPFGGHDISRWAIADLVRRVLEDEQLYAQTSVGINRPQ